MGNQFWLMISFHGSSPMSQAQISSQPALIMTSSSSAEEEELIDLTHYEEVDHMQEAMDSLTHPNLTLPSIDSFRVSNYLRASQGPPDPQEGQVLPDPQESQVALDSQESGSLYPQWSFTESQDLSDSQGVHPDSQDLLDSQESQSIYATAPNSSPVASESQGPPDSQESQGDPDSQEPACRKRRKCQASGLHASS